MPRACSGCPRLKRLEARVDKLEGKKKRIGFEATDVKGTALSAHDEDREETELVEVRKR